MTKNITVMLSSTIQDMVADRDAVMKIFERYPFVEVIGAKPIQKSVALNPFVNTLEMAEKCDFYILLLGSRYGFEIRPGTSATEAEFDRAVQANPTKVLVFKNATELPEPKQVEFIHKVGDYYKGYWISDYKFTHDLQLLVESSFLALLKDRASLGYKLTYIDHFVRLAVQRLPRPDAQSYYSTTRDLVELRYEFNGKSHIIQFSRDQVNNDFWGCISALESTFLTWR